jgi:hypothetical protein
MSSYTADISSIDVSIEQYSTRAHHVELGLPVGVHTYYSTHTVLYVDLQS